MNSLSDVNYKDKSECFCDPNKLSSAILKCGTSYSTILPGSNITEITTTATVASVTVNTSCFCNPCIKVEFASKIIVPIGIETANITFQMFKSCRNQFQPIPIGSQWTFQTSVGRSDVFSFFVCDCDTCSNECCNYTVQVTGTILDVGDGGGSGGNNDVIINSAMLSVIAIDNAK